MAEYRIKDGCKAFVNSALRTGGYVFRVEKEFKEVPEWAEKVTGAAAKKAASKPAPLAEPKSFVDTDLAKTPTVKL